MSKTEILAELSHLSPENLAEVQEYVDRMVQGRAKPAAPRLRSPKLANPSQANDFRKHVTESRSDAKL